MATSPPQALQALVTKLESDATLTDDERQVILSLPVQVRRHGAGEDIAREGDRPGQSCLVVEGWLYRYKTLRGGGRQILSLHVPGEIPDLQSLHLHVMDHTLAALSATTVAMIAHTDLFQLTSHHPRLAALLWRETLIDAAIFREWMTGLGRRDAYTRTAHLVCEIYVRLETVGLARGHRFVFPLTQSDLADVLGLTVVHVNRTLKALRGTALVTWQGRDVVVNDWRGLAAVAEFDPTYLHLKMRD